MQLLCVGLNHTTTPIYLREKVAFSTNQISQAVTEACTWFSKTSGQGISNEVAILSTCNRTELYVASESSDTKNNSLSIDSMIDFLMHYHKLRCIDLSPHLYTLMQDSAVRHIFRVASGLDSMVLGEAQILGQMKNAMRCAKNAGGLGIYLNQLFQRAFSVAKEVRSTTEIGMHSISMAAAAVRMSERIFDSITGKCTLFVGTNEIIELCAAHFGAKNPKSITIANRTLEHAELLAHRFNGQAIQLAELPMQLSKFDIIISCTASNSPIISLRMIEHAMRTRRHRLMFILDLAVPRDIEAEVGDLDDIFLYTIDNLGPIVQAGIENRRGAVSKAEDIIETRVQSFMQWVEKRVMVPIIKTIHESSEEIRCLELEKAKKMLLKGEVAETVLESLSKGLTAKFIHGSQQALHNSHGDERMRLAALLPQLFNTKR